MGNKATKKNMSVTRGSTWGDRWYYTDDNDDPIDLTGYTARMQIRTVAGRYGTSTAATLIAELTTANSGLVIEELAGAVDIYMSAVDTLTLSPENRRVRYYYSLELVDPTVSPTAVIPLLEGYINVYPETTR